MKNRSISKLVASIVVLGTLTFGMLSFSGIDSEKKIATTANKGYKIGDVATDFKLKNVDDTMVSLSNYKDAKGYIIVFTCNHCPCSGAYEDRIIALDTEFKQKGYPVIAINPSNTELYEADSFENMKIKAKEKGFTFPYLLDVEQTIFPQYGATKTPQIYILKKEAKGNIVKYIGAIDNNFSEAKVTKHYAKDAVNALLEGKEVLVSKTKAIGCGIN